MRSFWFLLLLVLIPAVHAVGLLVPPEFDSTVKVYTSNSTSVDVSIKGDSSNNTVTFFATSPDARLLINGVQSYSTTFTLNANQVRATTLRMTGLNSTSELTVDYGFLLGNSSVSSGIGFQQVTRDAFKVRVYCTGSCVATHVDPVVPRSTPGSTGAGGYIPPIIRNVTNSSNAGGAVIQQSPPVISDLSGASGSTDSMVNNDQTPKIPSISATSNVAQIANELTSKGGKGIALVLVGMLISVLVLEIAVYSVAKRMPD
jgi:hypothetical protein